MCRNKIKKATVKLETVVGVQQELVKEIYHTENKNAEIKIMGK